MTTEIQDNQLQIGDKIITLNDVQYECLKQGREFLSNDEENFFTISGSAGTGKSTIARAILQDQVDVIVTAPTHKAKKIISRSTGFRGETIQKILGMQPNVELAEYTQNNVLFELKGKNLLTDYKIILIDESSMLNSDLVDLIKSKAVENNTKVIFMGDARQLPPVKEKISKVFTDTEIKQFKLTKIERQQVGNPLIELYDKILNHIDLVDAVQAKIDLHNKALKKGSFLISDSEMKGLEDILNSIPFDIVSNMTDEGIGYKFYSDIKEFGDKATKSFKIGEDLDNRILCWTNNTVSGYNTAIRKKILPEPLKFIEVGEMLMAYKSLTDKDVWSHLIFENSADYKVLKVEEGYKHAETYDESIKADIKGWFVTIEDIDNDRGSEKIFVIKPESYLDFYKIEKNYGDFAKTSKLNKKWAWKQYYDFRNEFTLIGHIVNGKEKLVEKDFDYGYAITVHKSQGSTYQDVFVILDDILANPNPCERWRLAYVALSRPRKGAYILKSASF